MIFLLALVFLCTEKIKLHVRLSPSVRPKAVIDLWLRPSTQDLFTSRAKALSELGAQSKNCRVTVNKRGGFDERRAFSKSKERRNTGRALSLDVRSRRHGNGAHS